MRKRGQRISYKQSDIRDAIVGRSGFTVYGRKMSDLTVSELAYWSLSHAAARTRLGCLATLLEKLNHGHVVRGLLLSLDETEKHDHGEEKRTQ